MQTHTRTLLVAFVALALLLGAAGPALAQDAPGAPNGTQAQNETDTTPDAANETGNATGNASGNQSENESANGQNGGGLGSRLGGGFSLSLYEAENPVCQDMNAAASFTCDSVVGLLLAFGEAAKEFYVAIQIELISLMVDRPGAMQDGEMSLFGTPDNQPMTAIHGYWIGTILPASLILWAIIMVVNVLKGVLPFGGSSRYAQARAFETGILVFFGIIASWFIGNLILHAVFGLSAFLAPGPETLSTDPQVVQADTAAAVIGAIAIYFGFGVAAALGILMFGLTWLGLYLLLPALSVGMLFKQPKIWIIRRVNKYGDKVFDLFLVCALWPIPAAIVLGIGYPATAAIAEASPDFLAFIPGVASGMAATIGLLRLGVWIAALLAPLFIFALSSPSSAVMGAAGALGGYSLGAASGGAAGAASGTASGSAAGSASALPAAASGTATGSASALSSVGTNPIKGTSLSADTASSSAAGALPGGGSTPTGTATPTSVGSVATATGGSASSSSAGASASNALPGGDSPSGGASDSGGITSVTDRGEFDGSRRYEPGYQKDSGEFQPVSQMPMRGEALVDRGRGIQIQDAYDNDILLRDPDSGELMDVSQIAERDRDLDTQLGPDVQAKQSRDIVYGTRDGAPE